MWSPSPGSAWSLPHASFTVGIRLDGNFVNLNFSHFPSKGNLQQVEAGVVQGDKTQDPLAPPEASQNPWWDDSSAPKQTPENPTEAKTSFILPFGVRDAVSRGQFGLSRCLICSLLLTARCLASRFCPVTDFPSLWDLFPHGHTDKSWVTFPESPGVGRNGDKQGTQRGLWSHGAVPACLQQRRKQGRAGGREFLGLFFPSRFLFPLQPRSTHTGSPPRAPCSGEEKGKKRNNWG